MTTRAYIACCWDCGDVTQAYCAECEACEDCCGCGALFDADELGIDPEVDAERFEHG